MDSNGFFAMIGLGYIISPAGCDILSDTCDIMPSGASALLHQYGAAFTGEMTMRKDGFYMPARVLCGDDAVRKYAGEMKKFGSRALIVTGKHSADACGVLSV